MGDYRFQTELLDVWPQEDQSVLLRKDVLDVERIIDPLDAELDLVPLTIAKLSKLFGVAESSINFANILDSTTQAKTKHMISGGYLHLDEAIAQGKGRKYNGDKDIQAENSEREATTAYKSHNNKAAINLPFDTWKQSMFNEDALTAHAMTLKRWFFSQERDWYGKVKNANWHTKSKWFMCYLNSDEGRLEWNNVHPYLVLYWPYIFCFLAGYWHWVSPEKYMEAKNLTWKQLAQSNGYLVYKMLPEGRYTNADNEVVLKNPAQRAAAAEMMDTNETVTANDVQGDQEDKARNDWLTIIFDPQEPATWTGLGWLNKYNISYHQPLYPGPGQFTTGDAKGSYKSRYGIKKQYVQFYFYTQLYHRNGVLSEQSLKYALKSHPRKRHEKDTDPDHWTQDGAVQRVKRPTKAADGKWIADPNDTEHYSTYDHAPFRADMLYAGTSMQFGGTEMQQGTHRGVSMNLDAIPAAANWMLSYQKYTPFGEAVMTKRLDGSDMDPSDTKHRTILLEAYCKILALGSLPTPGRMHPRYFFNGFNKTNGKHCLGKMSAAADSKMRTDVKNALDNTNSTLSEFIVYDESTPLEELMEGLSLVTEEERAEVKVKGGKKTLATIFNEYEAGRECTQVVHAWKAVMKSSQISRDELPKPNWGGDASQSPIRLLASQLGLSVQGLHTAQGMTVDDLKAWNIALPSSDMTVYDFITSPYNLVHLPYRTVTYQFNIGEFWSPVCKRCVRPFYENKFIAIPFGSMSEDTILMGVRGRKIASDDKKTASDIDCERTAEDMFDEDKARKNAELKKKPYNVTNLRQFKDPLTNKVSGYYKIPDKLYKDPTGKRNTVYTLQWNVHHEQVSGVMTVDGLGDHDKHDRVWQRGDIPKGGSDDIPNGYIRQTDWRTDEITKENPDGYVYKFNRFTNPFCKHLRLKRQHPQGNLCTDCYIELGGEGRMGMDMIERLNAKPDINAPAPKKRDYVFTRQNDPRDVPKQVAASTVQGGENVGEEVQKSAEDEFDCSFIPCEEQVKKFKELYPKAYKIVVYQCNKIDVDPHQILLNIAGMSMIQWAHEKEAQAPSTWMTEGECVLDDNGKIAFCVLNDGLVEYFDMAKLKALKMVRRRDRVMESNGVTWRREQPSLKDTLDLPDPAAKSKRIEMDFQDYPEQIKSREELKAKLMADKSRVSQVTDLLDKIKSGGFDNHALNTQLISILLTMDDTVKKALEHYGAVIARRVQGDYDLHGNKMFDRYFSRVEYVKPKYRLIVHDKLVQEFRKLKIPGMEEGEEDTGKKYWAFDKSPDGSVDVIRLNHNRITGEDGKLIHPDLDGDTFQKQIRPMRMSHIMITYVLHHRALHTSHNRYVMHQMAAAASHIFKHPHILEQMIRFGQRVMKGGGRSLIVRRKNANDLYDNYTDTYPYDEFATHMHYTEVDGGIEIAPITGFFHWHIMLKMVHFSKLMFDYLQMRNWLELSFKGLHADPEDNFVIWDHDGSLFYKDTDVPYIDVRLHAQDDWDEVIKSYMHKSEDAIIEQVRRADVKNPIAS